MKVPAKKSSKRIGSLVVNPGGPGGSGVDYARAADFIVGKGVRDAYDVVGFDPRGVGRSAPIDCVTDSELDAFLGSDPTPDDAAEEQAFAATSKGFADSCAATAGPLLGHVSTVDAARDMDVLRATLGEEKLTYLGKSYGTYLGSVYAGLFPTNVGRMVLDGVVAPDLTPEQLNLGQAKGFELATRQWAAYCVEEGDCPLGGSVDDVMKGLRTFLGSVDSSPLPRTGDNAVPRLTEGWASLGIAAAMYDQGAWQTLTDAMRDAVGGDGTALMQLADQYADRNPGGQYAGNIMEVIYAVNCLDKPDTNDLAERHRLAEESLEGRADVGAVPHVELAAVRLLAGEGDRHAREDQRHRGAAHRRHRHHPRPRHALRVGGAAARPARRGLAHHLRRRRPHGLHPLQRVRRRRRRRLLPRRHRAQGRPALLSGADGVPGSAPGTRRRPPSSGIRGANGRLRILVRRARAPSGARRLSSVGQSDSLVMNRSRVRFP